MSENVQLLLVVPCVDEIGAALEDALQRHTIACVLITPPAWQAGAAVSADDADLTPCDPQLCGSLVALAQRHDVAAIVANELTESRAPAERIGIRIGAKTSDVRLADNQIDGFATPVADLRNEQT